MVNYKNSKIYKIVCKSTGDTYFGSTTQQKLSSRMNTHRKHNSNLLSKIIIQRNNYSYHLVENFSCDNHDELRCRLYYYIDTYDCIHKPTINNIKHSYTENNVNHIETIQPKIEPQKQLITQQPLIKPQPLIKQQPLIEPQKQEQAELEQHIEIEHKKPIIKQKIRYKMNIKKTNDPSPQQNNTQTQQQNIQQTIKPNNTQTQQQNIKPNINISNTRKRNNNDKCLIIPPKTQTSTETQENSNNSDSEYEPDDIDSILNLGETNIQNLDSDSDSQISDSDSENNTHETKLPTLNTKLKSTLKKGYKKKHENSKFKYISEILEKA